jgi:ABC-type multidrug transport system fused ATPase/permease subunit
MNYDLNQALDHAARKPSVLTSLRKLVTIISGERRNLIIAFVAIFLNAGLNLLGPYLVGYTIDNHVQMKDYDGGTALFRDLAVHVYWGICGELCTDAPDGRYWSANALQAPGFSISQVAGDAPRFFQPE